jgi:hypothetical protein
MTAYTRFQNVTLPKGAIIDSAFLMLYAHEDENDEALLKVYAEAIDDSPEFSENEAITDRTWTDIYIEWNETSSWTMWEPYSSPDLKTLIQATIDREKDGNMKIR